MSNRAETIRVRRRMPAPREVVYEAWTTAEGFRHWMCPGDVVSTEATLDVRVGGAFQIVMKSPTTEHVQTGVYQIVDPPAKLVFTWNSSNHPPTRVIVDFIDHDDESEIVITHEEFTIPDIAKRYEGGWGTIADKLAAYLAKRHRQNQPYR
jgi:uncharacterized protein YndB with AHSA1/START domain